VAKTEGDTDPNRGCRPDSRPLSLHRQFGIINLDKPPGPSSHEVVAWVKRMLKLNHAGHGGTLDPKVTGVLPLALEDATKLVQAFLLSGKEYVCLMQLHSKVPEEKLRHVFQEFIGEIYQRPPLRSSVKRDVRKRKIYKIDLLEIVDNQVLFKVSCQAGTYVRKLCFDIGEALGCGAHMKELRRTRAGPFTENEKSYTLYDLLHAHTFHEESGDETKIREVIRPMEEALEYIPKIYIRDSAVDAICHGADLAIPGIVKLDSKIKPRMSVGLFTLKNEVVALAKALMSTEQIIEQERGLAAKTLRVIMPIGTYPRLWKEKQTHPASPVEIFKLDF